jgi:hypothetical protein
MVAERGCTQALPKFFFTIQLRVRISVGKLLWTVFALHGPVLGGDLPFEHRTVEGGVFQTWTGL